MISLLKLFDSILDLYTYVVLAYVILSWLINFNVVNAYNAFVQTIQDITTRLVEPVLVRIRRFVPSVSGLDLSPIVLLLLLFFVRSLLREYGPALVIPTPAQFDVPLVHGLYFRRQYPRPKPPPGTYGNGEEPLICPNT